MVIVVTKRIMILCAAAILLIVAGAATVAVNRRPVKEETTTVATTVQATVTTTKKPVPVSAKIENVAYINQIALGYPMGCEAASATMLLNFYGYDVKMKQVIDATPTGSGKYEKDGVWYAADPFEQFAGDPRKRRTAGSYGCFAKPMVQAMNGFADGRAKEISGCEVEDLFRYVSEGKPVMVWGASNGNEIKEGVLWHCVDADGNPTGKTFRELEREHCMLLIGYDEDSVLLHDPAREKNVEQTLELFTSNWKKLYSQAIIIE